MIIPETTLTMQADGVVWSDQAQEYAVIVGGQVVTYATDHGAANQMYREMAQANREHLTRQYNSWQLVPGMVAR